MYKKIIVNEKTEDFLSRGNSWIYERSILSIPELDNGDIVKVSGKSGKFYGMGYYCADSVIKVRMISSEIVDLVDENFFIKRFFSCLEYRKSVLNEKSSYRMVFSEGDMLSGIIIDVFEGHAVIQLNTSGIFRYKDIIVSALIKVLEPKSVYIKQSSVSQNSFEGTVFGDLPERLVITENNINYCINIKEFQKTGFFLDQYINRIKIGRFSRNKEVIDIFCNSGGFGFNCLKNGASKVTFLDSSRFLSDIISENCKLNDIEKDRIEVRNCDAFDFLGRDNRKYDLIILDPPALTKTSKKSGEAIKGYLYLNIRCLERLNPGGVLATFSCSQNIDTRTFMAVCGNAMKKTGGIYNIIDHASQSYDHPVIDAQPETHYLKGLFIRKYK